MKTNGFSYVILSVLFDYTNPASSETIGQPSKTQGPMPKYTKIGLGAFLQPSLVPLYSKQKRTFHGWATLIVPEGGVPPEYDKASKGFIKPL